jgi:hypothetical protein
MVSVHHGEERVVGAEKFTSRLPGNRERGIQEGIRTRYSP